MLPGLHNCVVKYFIFFEVCIALPRFHMKFNFYGIVSQVTFGINRTHNFKEALPLPQLVILPQKKAMWSCICKLLVVLLGTWKEELFAISTYLLNSHWHSIEDRLINAVLLIDGRWCFWKQKMLSFLKKTCAMGWSYLELVSGATCQPFAFYIYIHMFYYLSYLYTWNSNGSLNIYASI